MKYYCTLFDRNYLERGLILYSSLMAQFSQEFRLSVLPLDDDVAHVIHALNNESLVSLSLQAFINDQELTQIKKNRNKQEFAWTSASQLMQWLLCCDMCNIPDLTYLDADMMFFFDPQVVFDEIGDNSIGIIPHRFTPQNRTRLEKNGRFNVSWVTAKNDAIGRECISLWARQCRDWCYNRHEDGKFGDQKYLNEWPELYKGHVCEISNPGAGLAPWNLPNYRIAEGPTVDGQPLVFYHFHEYSDGIRLTNYPLRDEDKNFIYRPYIEEHKRIKQTLESIHIFRG